MLVKRSSRVGFMTRVEFQKMNMTSTQIKFFRFLRMKDRHRKLLDRKGRSSNIAKVPSRKLLKTSPAICKVLLIGYSEGYFSKQEVSGLLGIKEKHIPEFLKEVAKW